jgi:hypothetical protein
MKILVVGGLSSNPGPDDRTILRDACLRLGGEIHRRGHAPVICSVHDNVADIDVVRGAAGAVSEGRASIIAHVPRDNAQRRRLEALASELPVSFETRSHSTPSLDNEQSRTYAYLTCQLLAADEADTVLVLGGRQDGAASLFLTVQAARGRRIVPLRFLGGAVSDWLWGKEDDYEELVDGDVGLLDDSRRVEEAVALAEKASGISRRHRGRKFFISYSRKQDDCADVVEKVIRRKNATPFRDDEEITIGQEWEAQIKKALNTADVFVALWSRDYACSPHCFIEMEHALMRMKLDENGGFLPGSLQVWLYRLDETPITFPRARKLQGSDCETRKDLRDQLTLRMDRWEREECPR